MLLERLSTADGPSGHEEPVTALIREAMAPFVDELRVDALGNLIGLRRGEGREAPAKPGRPTLMLAAHQDEIGLMVTQIVEDGFLRFTTIGGWDPRVLPTQAVWVHGRRRLAGIVGARPPHLLDAEERGKVTPLDALFIDLGLPEEAVREAVRVGDAVTVRRRPLRLQSERWAGKAMDNRASVAAMLLALEELARRRHAWDVLAVATVQEEIGLKGAATAAFGLDPTIAVAIDVSFARQPGAADLPYLLGGGPMLGYGPNIHPFVHQGLQAAADALEMATQLEPLPGASGTDAWAIQVAREGIPTGLVSIPLRYMHSSVETLSMRDLRRTGRLLAAYASSLGPADRDRLLARMEEGA